MSPSAELTVRRFQSEVDEIREAPEPIAARMTVFVLAGFVLSLVAIMVFTRIDRVITSVSGKIVPLQAVQVYQALDTSIIKSLDVREGDEVKAGQLLATLDATFATADVRQLKLQIASADAQIARDEAELDNHPLTFPDYLLSDQEPDLVPDYRRYTTSQKLLYDQQVGQYAAQINSYNSQISQNNATIVKYQADENHYGQRQELAKKQEQMRITLVQRGAGSEVNTWIAQDALEEITRQRQYDQNSLTEAQNTLATTAANKDAFVKQWFVTLSQELVTGRNTRDAARSQLDKATKHQDLVRLTAPEASMVLTEAKLSVGSVLREGDTLLTMMPLNSPVEAEFHILSRDIGFIRAGDECTLKVDAFQFTEHGTASGHVKWISDGAFTTNDDTGQPTDAYYKARCGVDETDFRNIPANFRLIPGMTLQADVNVGKRSVAMYLLGTVLRGYNKSMREP